MEEIEKAYIAGIVDGEGTVTLMKHHRNETSIPQVAVANNNLALLKWLKARAAEIISRKKKRLFHHRDSYAWSVRQDRAIRFLNEIKQYLIIKRHQADLITEKYKSVTHRAGKYIPELLRKKMRLVA